MAIAELLLTAEEFGQLPDRGGPMELIRGKVIEKPPPKPRHGQVCNKVGRLLGNHAEEHDSGHVVCNDAGVITRRDPDTVRGADVAFYSFARVPKGPLPDGYLPIPPDLVFEVRSSSDRWRDVVAKVAEYLNVGVVLVCVLDPESESAHLYHADRPVRVLGPDDEFAIPELLGDFRVAVRRFFE